MYILREVWLYPSEVYKILLQFDLGVLFLERFQIRKSIKVNVSECFKIKGNLGKYNQKYGMFNIFWYHSWEYETILKIM